MRKKTARTMFLSADDRDGVMNVAADLYDGRSDNERSETIRLRSGAWVDVSVSDDGRVVYLTRRSGPQSGRVTRLAFAPGARLRVGTKRAAGRKTATRKKAPAKKTANPVRKATPASATARAFAKAGFRLTNTGGGIMAYRRERASGATHVMDNSGEGNAPTRLTEAVEVFDFDADGDVTSVREFASASAYLRTQRSTARKTANPARRQKRKVNGQFARTRR